MKEKTKIAVIVGRFQVPQLTLGHFWLILTAFCEFDKVVILIGDTKVLPNGFKRMDSHDPFPYELRAQMISSYIREYIPFSKLDNLLGIYRFEDVGNLPLWNSKLDDFHASAKKLRKRKKLFVYGVLINIVSLVCLYIIPLFALP